MPNRCNKDGRHRSKVQVEVTPIPNARSPVKVWRTPGRFGPAPAATSRVAERPGYPLRRVTNSAQCWLQRSQGRRWRRFPAIEPRKDPIDGIRAAHFRWGPHQSQRNPVRDQPHEMPETGPRRTLHRNHTVLGAEVLVAVVGYVVVLTKRVLERSIARSAKMLGELPGIAIAGTRGASGGGCSTRGRDVILAVRRYGDHIGRRFRPAGGPMRD